MQVTDCYNELGSVLQVYLFLRIKNTSAVRKIVIPSASCAILLFLLYLNICHVP